MRSSDKQYNTSCDVSSVCEYESICNDESDLEHLLHNQDELHDKKATDVVADIIPISISPIIIPQIQNKPGNAAKWQRRHNRFVIESLMM